MVLEQTIIEAGKKGRRHWHWNERGPKELINSLKISHLDTDVRVILALHYLSIWTSLSQFVHVSANWETPTITFNSNGRIDFVDPLARDDQRAAAAAGLAFTLLKDIQSTTKEILHNGLKGPE